MSPSTARFLVVARRIGIALTFILVLLRPGVGEADAPTQLADVDVLVVLDRTRSMAALDFDDREPRINGVKADLVALAEDLPGARFGMLTFGAEARLVLPFSTDVTAFESAVDTVYLEGPQDGEGSRADRPVPELTEVLKRAEEQRPERRRVVVYVGDGEDTAEGQGSADPTFEDVADLIAGGIVLGYGTEQGATMPSSSDLDIDEGYVLDPETNQSAVSKADLGNLEKIADELGVAFAHRTSTAGIAEIAESFEASYVDGEGGDGLPAKHDLTWLFGLVLLALVLAELRAGWRGVWSARNTLLPPSAKGAAR